MNTGENVTVGTQQGTVTAILDGNDTLPNEYHVDINDKTVIVDDVGLIETV